MENPKHPWRLDSNERYREVIKMITNLSTACLLLPIFFARDFLSISKDVPLKEVFTCSIYWSWAFFIINIILGVLFHYISAKWIRLAWDQPVKLFFRERGDKTIEGILDKIFWGIILSFFAGIAALLYFVVKFTPS
jgi:hypothetical protein